MPCWSFVWRATGSNPKRNGLFRGLALVGDSKQPEAKRSKGLDVRLGGVFAGQALGGFGRHEAGRARTGDSPTYQGCKGQQRFRSYLPIHHAISPWGRWVVRNQSVISLGVGGRQAASRNLIAWFAGQYGLDVVLLFCHRRHEATRYAKASGSSALVGDKKLPEAERLNGLDVVLVF